MTEEPSVLISAHLLMMKLCPVVIKLPKLPAWQHPPALIVYIHGAAFVPAKSCLAIAITSLSSKGLRVVPKLSSTEHNAYTMFDTRTLSVLSCTWRHLDDSFSNADSSSACVYVRYPNTHPLTHVRAIRECTMLIVYLQY